MPKMIFMSTEYVGKVVDAIEAGIGDDYVMALRKQKIRDEH